MTTQDTLIQLSELEAAAKAATPGPWSARPDGVSSKRVVALTPSENGGWEINAQAKRATSQEDAEFIALCDPDTVLALIAATKQLEETGRWINNGRSVVDRSVHRGGKAVDDINFDIANALLPFQADNREE